MARRTFADFDTELNIAVGKRPDFTSAIRGFVLDQGYYYVANAIRHPELETTMTATLTSATSAVALNSDFWFPELVRNQTAGQQILPGALREFLAQTVPTGNPSRYDRWGDSFEFDKAPSTSQTIKIWYTRRPTEPASGDNSVLDELYDQLIMMYSIKFAHEELRDYDQAGKMMLAIRAYTTDIKAPWRMTKTDDRNKQVSVRMR